MRVSGTTAGPNVRQYYNTTRCIALSPEDIKVKDYCRALKGEDLKSRTFEAVLLWRQSRQWS
jgi:hypothetical protein